MNLFLPQYTPAIVQDQCGIFPSTLRDWRSRDFSKHIGTVGKNGRWKYSAVDMAELAIANLATRSGIEGFLAFRAAHECAPAAFHFWGAPVSPIPERFTYFWRRFPISIAVPIVDMFNWSRTDDLSKMSGESCAVAFLFDGKTFAIQYADLGNFLRHTVVEEADS